MIPFYIYLVVGLGIFFLINRSRFNRRNSSGVEIYENYAHATGSSIINRILKIVAVILIMAGLGGAFMEYSLYTHNKTEQSKQQEQLKKHKE